MQANPRTQQSWTSTGICVVERTSTLAMRHCGNLERLTLDYKRTRAMRTQHRKDSGSRRRSAPDTSTGPTKMMRVTRRREKTGQRRIRRFADSPFRRFMPFLVCVLAIAMAGASFAQDEEQEEETSNAKPDAGGIVIDPSSGKIAEGDTITITFPVSTVAADLIDAGDQSSPLASEPKLDGTFLWKSQTEGVFTVTGVVAQARHRLKLAPGLKDATG